MAGSIPYTRIDIQNTSIDAASYVATTWLAVGDLNQKFSLISLEVGVGTGAILYKVLSTSSAGTSPFATLAMNEGVSLTAGNVYGFDTMAKASVYMNFQFSATTTVEEFWGVERLRW